jgi:hypothetical protein
MKSVNEEIEVVNADVISVATHITYACTSFTFFLVNTKKSLL